MTEDAPSPLNPLGIKSVGEGGITGVGAVIAAAIDDAIGMPGGVTRLPATPQRIKALLREASQRGRQRTGRATREFDSPIPFVSRAVTVAICVGIWANVVFGRMRILGRAARSNRLGSEFLCKGLAVSFCAKDCHPLTCGW